MVMDDTREAMASARADTLPRQPDLALRFAATATRTWFAERYRTPTAAQRLAWPVVVSGESLLLCTPTGTGKTLAAMLPVFDRIRTERANGLQALYIAPLKALVQDTYITLRRLGYGVAELEPLDGTTVRIGLRTGETPARVRARQLDEPPHILLTTPESLAILLTSSRAAEVFAALRWVVVDEVHALAGTKRGADFALSLERVELLARCPLQRIGLSATCRPVSTAAQFLCGVSRPCRILQVNEASELELRVEPLAYEHGPGFLTRLLTRLEGELAANRTTLIFTNTRSLAERVTWALRQRYPTRADDIATHHSALAPARRRLVERAMKQGRLWVAVSSTSLELGIDIGSVDGVVFVHPPGSVVRLLQRLGRSGHRPGVLRRGLVLTSSPRELLEATVCADCGRHGQIETLDVAAHPFDVLCQQLAGMAMTGAWTADDAYALVRRALPYRDLSRTDFDDCIDYLSGRKRDGTSWLPARLRWQGDTFAIADERTARLLRRNLGTILTEDPCAVRMPLPADPASDELPRTSLVGELDEIYAQRLQPGDRFMLDGRCLEYQSREGSSLLVDEVLGRPQVPRWHGSGPPMSSELASRLYLFRVLAAEALRDGRPCLERLLGAEYRLNQAATASLTRYFTRQETISEIPDAGVLLIERLAHQACTEYSCHTPLPAPANEALVRVVCQRLQRTLGLAAVPLAADLGFVIVLETPTELTADTWRTLLAADRFTEDFAEALRVSALLRDRFGQVAQTGMMVLRNPQGHRPRVGGKHWAREQLFEQIRSLAPDFVLLRQAEREASAGVCDHAGALAYVHRLPLLQLHVRRLAEPSPFADSLLAGQTGPLQAHACAEDALQQLQRELLDA
jgi:ATP-dependent Lhr-like helicase